MPKGVYSIPGRRKAWTADEDMLLVDLFERGMSEEQIAKRMGRSLNSVHVRASRTLKRREVRPLSARGVAEMLGFSCSKKAARLIRDGLIKGKRTAVGAGKARRYAASEEDVLAFMEDPEHWHLWRADDIEDRDLREWAEGIRSERYLTQREVADRYHVVIGTVGAWLDRGQLPYVRFGRGNRVIPASALEGFVIPSERTRTGGTVRRFTPSEDRRLLQMRWDGMSWNQIADSLGRSMGSVAGRHGRLMQRREQLQEAA